MLDFGSWELLLVIMLGIVVIGPKELPGVIRTVGLWVRRAKDLAREFQGGLEDIARETEIDKFKSDLEAELGDANSIGQEIAADIDQEGDFAKAFDYDDSDWYSDHHDDAEDDEAAGPPMVEDLAETSETLDTPETIVSDAPAETVADDAIDTDAKTGA